MKKIPDQHVKDVSADVNEIYEFVRAKYTPFQAVGRLMLTINFIVFSECKKVESKRADFKKIIMENIKLLKAEGVAE